LLLINEKNNILLFNINIIILYISKNNLFFIFKNILN